MLRRIALALITTCLLPSAWGAGAVLGPADLGINGASLTQNPNATLFTGGFSAMTVYLNYSRGAATAVTMACTGGPSRTNQFPINVANVAANGIIAVTPASFTAPVTQNANLRILVAPLQDSMVNCAFSGTGANANDTISAYVRLGN